MLGYHLLLVTLYSGSQVVLSKTTKIGDARYLVYAREDFRTISSLKSSRAMTYIGAREEAAVSYG